MTDLPRIPDELYGRLSPRDRQIARDVEALRRIAMAPTIEERDGLADRADVALRRLRRAIADNKQNPNRWGNLDRATRLPDLGPAVRELIGQAMNPGSILYADRDERYMDMGGDILELLTLLGWIPRERS